MTWDSLNSEFSHFTLISTVIKMSLLDHGNPTYCTPVSLDFLLKEEAFNFMQIFMQLLSLKQQQNFI